MAHGLRLNSIAESAPLEALRRRKVSCAPLPERHPGPSNSVKNPTSAPLGELPPAVAHFSCSPLGMLGHNQPDEFRTHGVAGRPVLKDLPTTAGRHEKVQTYEVVNPDSGVHDAWQPTRKSAAPAVLQTSTTTATYHPPGFGAALRAQPPICVRLRKSQAKGPQVQIPNQDTHPDQRFHRPYPVQGWRSCCGRRCVRSRPAHV
jgi:hypothetical protein